MQKRSRFSRRIGSVLSSSHRSREPAAPHEATIAVEVSSVCPPEPMVAEIVWKEGRRMRERAKSCVCECCERRRRRRKEEGRAAMELCAEHCTAESFFFRSFFRFSSSLSLTLSAPVEIHELGPPLSPCLSLSLSLSLARSLSPSLPPSLSSQSPHQGEESESRETKRPLSTRCPPPRPSPAPACASSHLLQLLLLPPQSLPAVAPPGPLVPLRRSCPSAVAGTLKPPP